MSQIKVGRQSIDTQNIAMIADTYAIVNQHGKAASSFVLTHEPAPEFAKKVIAADPSIALVSTGPNGRGNFLNIDYIKEVQDHSVEMDFGTKEVDAKVPTELTKEEMQQQMNHVSDFVLQGMAKRNSEFGFNPTLGRERPSSFVYPVNTSLQADRSQMMPSDKVSKTNPDLMADGKILDNEKIDKLREDLLSKDFEITASPYQKLTRFDSSQLGPKESSRKLPDVPTGGSGVDDGMDFDG